MALIETETIKAVWYRCQACWDVVSVELGNWLDDGDYVVCPKCGGRTTFYLTDEE